MPEQVTLVETNGRKMMSFSAAEQGDVAPPDLPERRGAKFVYPGGARPLEGYTLKRGVGHGGFGEIYYAVSDAGKEVALKLIRRNLEVELRGIRHCLNLKHPNLLAIFDIRQDEHGDSWVVMEYVAGGCLEDAIAVHPQGMPAEQALAWFHGMANGVAYLHDRGVVHRDLKPANIFSDEGVVKVGDYGLSKFISCSRRSGQTESVGTVHYMAPEVANGRYGKEIDVYALGIILYEMLTGRVPFEGESVGEVLMKHLTTRPDLSLLSEPYRSVVAKALEKDPSHRYGSVADMLAALPQPRQPSAGTGRVPPTTYGLGAPGDARTPLNETIIQAVAADEEPIWRAIRENWLRLHSAWNQANLALPVKIILLVAGMFVFVLSAPYLLPMVIGLCVLYGIYRLIRMLALPAQTPVTRGGGVYPAPAVAREVPPRPVPAPSPSHPAYAQTNPGRRYVRAVREKAVPALVVKSPREQFTELLGSLLVGSAVAAAMCVVMLMINTYRADVSPQPEQVAWLFLVSVAGTWSVLIPAKFWEGHRGEVMLRRFVLMVVGLVVGSFAFGMAQTLMVQLPYDFRPPGPRHLRLPLSFYNDYGQPQVMAYLACFGALFLLIRWWRQADPLRGTRLSLWSMLITGVMAWLVAQVLHFPWPWLVMVAGAMSVSVQLASPWAHPRDRIRKRSV